MGYVVWTERDSTPRSTTPRSSPQYLKYLYVLGSPALFRNPQLLSNVKAVHEGLALQLDSTALISPHTRHLAPPWPQSMSLPVMSVRVKVTVSVDAAAVVA